MPLLSGNIPLKASTLICDFDGTLADTLPLTMEIFNQLAEKHSGQKLDPENLAAFRQLSAREFLKSMGIPLWRAPSLLAEGQKILATRQAEIHPFPGVVAALKTLADQGWQLGIVSSNRHDIIKHFVQRFKLPPLQFLVTEKSLFGKGAVLRKLIRTHHLDPAQTWYLGDEVRDAEAAKAAALRFVGVSWGFNTAQSLERAGVTTVISRPYDLRNALTL